MQSSTRLCTLGNELPFGEARRSINSRVREGSSVYERLGSSGSVERIRGGADHVT